MTAPPHSFRVHCDGYDDLAVGAPGEDNNRGAVNVILGGQFGLRIAGDQYFTGTTTGEQFGHSMSAGRIGSGCFVDLVVGAPYFTESGKSSVGRARTMTGSTSGLATGTWFKQGSGNVPGGAETNDRFGWSVEIGDINCDNQGEVIFGVPYEHVGSLADAGWIVVGYPGTNGSLSTSDSFGSIHQDTSNVPGLGEAGDLFGWALDTGDIGTGCDDLVVGVPGEDIASIIDAGAIVVLHGISGTSFPATGSYSRHQDSSGIAGGAEGGDEFGSAVAVGNYNGVGNDDVAVGVPGEAVGSGEFEGAINVIYGGSTGLVSTGNKFFSQSGPVAGSDETGDNFGAALS